MIYCPQCGAESPSAARFCDQCGSALVPVSSPPVSSRPAVVPSAPRPTSVTVAPPTPSVAMPMNTGVVTCPQCGASALPGEAFCDNCGASLSPLGATTPAPASRPALAPQPVYPAPQPVASYTPVSSPVVTRTTLAPARLTLDNGVVLSLPASAEATIGRADPVSHFVPEIDLATHGALDNGVGRRHARIFLRQGQVYIEDLDSTNGTSVNSQQLGARSPRQLSNGDQLQLGKLRLQFQL